VANMMINNPAEYRKIAREWAIRYANAPRDLSASASTPVPPTDPYAGYKREDVENFVGMGFKTSQVVAAMVAAGVPKGKKPTDDQADAIVEKLLG
jgi:ubiquitin-conjugating enzyme (huntingtin interacting protein 2)